MTHDPLCVLDEPCDEETPEHGYCGFSAPLYCIHCHRWCICERLDKARADEREKAAQRVAATEQHWSVCPQWAAEPCTCGTGRLIHAARGEA